MASRIEAEAFKQGRTVASVLRKADLSCTTVSLMKKQRNGPTAKTMERICLELGKDPNWLFGWEVPE
jgi:hypothetical protein